MVDQFTTQVLRLDDEPLVLKRRGFRIPWRDIMGIILYGFVFGVPWAVGVAYIISELFMHL